MAKKRFEGLSEEEIEKALLENIDDKLDKSKSKSKKKGKKKPKVETVEKITVVKEIKHADEKSPANDPSITEVRRPNVFLVKFKTYMIIFLLILLVSFISIFIMIATGFKDFQDDGSYIIIAKHGTQGEAAVLYELKSLEYEPLDLSTLPPISDIDNFYDYAKKNLDDHLDKIIIINVNSMSDIAIDESFDYGGYGVAVVELEKYLKGELDMPERVEGDDPEWKAKSKLFGEYIKANHVKLWLKFENRFPLMMAYKNRKIDVEPMNGVLYVLRLFPMEELITRL